MSTRIAMWSGPRNVSTALMRSFSSRADTAVIDEPLYAHYLAETGLQHPGRNEVIATYETDWRRVVDDLTGPVPDGRAVGYQKHMTHHLLPHIDREWVFSLRNAFLIRNPRDVLTSYMNVIEEPTLEDLGLPQQIELFERVSEREGAPAPVVDSKDLLLDPEGVLGALCDRLGIAFDPAMLAWNAGPHPADGCWAPHWYASVEASTGFAPYRPKDAVVPERLEALARESESIYKRLHPHRIRA